MNSYMGGGFPKLLPGMNAISWTGNVTSIVVPQCAEQYKKSGKKEPIPA